MSMTTEDHSEPGPCPKCGERVSKAQLEDGLCNVCHYCQGSGVLPMTTCDMCLGTGRLHPISLKTVQRAFASCPPPVPVACAICGLVSTGDHEDDEGVTVCRDELRRQLAAMTERAEKAEGERDRIQRSGVQHCDHDEDYHCACEVHQDGSQGSQCLYHERIRKERDRLAAIVARLAKEWTDYDTRLRPLDGYHAEKFNSVFGSPWLDDLGRSSAHAAAKSSEH